jgi:hypothetical protein
VAFRFRRRFKASDDGCVEVRLSPQEREVLRGLADELATMLDNPTDPALRRLFPPSYTEDPVHEAAYQMMMGDDLRQRHLGAARQLAESADVERLDPEQANAWLQSLNGVRLVLGTRLDVTEDGPVRVSRDDPNLPLWSLYEFLAMLLDELVHALAV